MRVCIARMALSSNGSWMTTLFALLLTLLTYPAFEPDFSIGLDSSYVWGMNHLFDNNYSTLTQLIYPYGPFAWLRIPVVGNGHYSIFLLFFSLLKFAFAWMLIDLSRRRQQPMILTLVAAIPACLYANIDVLIVADVALLLVTAIEKRKFLFFFLATLLAVFSLSIKVSIGVSSCVVLFVGWLLLIVYQKELKYAKVAAIAVFATLLVVGMLVWHSFPALWQALVGMLRVTEGYSEALVSAPEHKGWSLVLFAISMISLALTLKGKWTRYTYLLLVIPLFASWKYGVTREDFVHFKQLVAFTVCFVVLTGLAQDGFHWLPWLCGIAGYAMLMVNLSALNYSDRPSMASGPCNLVSRVIKSSELAAESRAYIEKSLNLRKLDNRVVTMIGSATVDCYPWEHVYLAANNLNWQPHKTVELGTGNSEWLNKQSAENFGSQTNAVSYVILHKVNLEREDGLRSIDDRYLLNDEPAVIDSLLTNYTMADSGWYGLLLRHGNACHKANSGIVMTTTVSWNEWVPLPQQSEETVMRAKVFSHLSFVGWLKKFLYKSDVYFVDYQMPDGSVLTYRYSRSTAESGLWMGPMLKSNAELADFFSDVSTAPQPQAIRFRTASMNERNSSGLQKPLLTVQFRKALGK